MRYLLILAGLILAACGAPAATPLTAAQVIERFTAAGLEATNVTTPERDPSAPLPNSYRERVTFTIPSLGDSGGQVFTCDTKANCDALYAYFDALKALGGPYYWQSPSGLVVVQLNSGLSPDEAAQWEAVIKALP